MLDPQDFKILKSTWRDLPGALIAALVVLAWALFFFALAFCWPALNH